MLKIVKQEARNGHISRAVGLLQNEIDQGTTTYAMYSNLAALELQRGNTNTSTHHSTHAITLDPYSHIAYYNRFLARLKSHPELAYRDIKKGLSCLYVLRGFEIQE